MTAHQCRGRTCTDPSHDNVTVHLDPRAVADVTAAMDAFRASTAAATAALADLPPSLFDDEDDQ